MSSYSYIARSLSTCVATALLGLAGCGDTHLPISGRTVESSLLSKSVADQSYRIYVRLPPSYDQAAAKQFPVVYQLDANFLSFDQFGVTAGLASKLEAAGQIPEVIVVTSGISPSGIVSHIKSACAHFIIIHV